MPLQRQLHRRRDTFVSEDESIYINGPHASRTRRVTELSRCMRYSPPCSQTNRSHGRGSPSTASRPPPNSSKWRLKVKVQIMHKDAFAFSGTDLDWEELGLAPIGMVQDEEEDWFPLAIDAKRQPFLVDTDGPHPLDKEKAGTSIYRALDETCERLWGHSWNSSVGEIFRLNRRTTQRDRVSRYLLPPPVLQVVAYVASADDSQELAGALLAFARYAAKTKSKEEAVRYWMHAAKVFYGEAKDLTVGVHPAPFP